MFSIIFLVLSTMIGYVLIKTCLKEFHITAADRTDGAVLSAMLRFSSAFIVGVVAAGLLTYACCMLFATTEHAITYGTILSMCIMTAIVSIFRKITGITRENINLRHMLRRINMVAGRNAFLCCFFFVLTIFFVWFYFYSFFYKNGAIAAGYSVFSDFGPHVALIRSFSVGGNFPAQYPHFPDGTMRYHFMFHFVAGVLEFLGLRIDFAFNILSILCVLCCMMLLFVLTVRLTKKKAAGYIAIVLFWFRSSFAAFTYLFDGTKYESISQFAGRIFYPEIFIGKTTYHESWGLWCNNVYANQRHLALGISLILIAILAFLPLVQKGFKNTFFTKKAWLPKNFKRAIFLGLLLGLAAYFHGSGVVAALGILAVMAIFSARKLEYAVTAAIALAFSVLQNAYFSSGAGTISPQFQFGFLVEEPTAINIASYLIELTGIVFVVVLIGAVLNYRKRGLQMLAAFLVPAVLTFTLSLTPDITVNHKFLMISLTLLNIYAAYVIIWIVEILSRCRMRIIGTCIAVVLTLVLTISGIIDTFAYIGRNGPGRSALYEDKTSATVAWIRENTPKGSVFASSWHVHSPVFLAGRYEFLGWPYFGWSAGYDTNERRRTIAEIFKTRDATQLQELLLDNGISYVYVDEALQNQMDEENVTVDYETLSTALDLVFFNERENAAIFALK